MANNYTNRKLLDYNFNADDDVNYKSAAEKASAADTKYNSIVDWKYGSEDAWSKAKDALTNRKAFSYDLNADALYQQYKDQYKTQGKLASQDVMGQAAALTGGYASSYAATVGNQAYQGYLQGLNDKVPELYQLAMQRYNMEGDQLRTAYDVLNSDRESDYTKFMGNKNILFNEMSHYNTLKDAAYTQAQTNYNNSLTSNNDNYWSEYNAGYQEEQDKIANQLASDQLKLQQEQFNWQKEQSDIEAKYAGWVPPEVAKAGEGETAKAFIASILTPREFVKRGKAATVDGKSKRFDNHLQYVDAVLENWYDNGQLTENEVKYLKGYYGLTD